MYIVMNQLAEGDGSVLAGSPHGRRFFARMMEATGPEPNAPEPVFLDFADVQVATASFLRETVFAYRDAVRRRRSNFYPVVANAAEAVRDELIVLTAASNDVLLTCSLGSNGEVLAGRLVGELDLKQRITFDLVRERGETDAAELMREHGEDEGNRVTQTAWNNRLAALANRGLVVELSRGRTKRYRPLLQEG